MKKHKSGATHEDTPPTNAKVGFTLAEVLITLGIIGIVAAMTLPTLIANVNSAKYRTQFKKTLSAVNQAVKLNEAKYDFGVTSCTSVCNYKSTAPENQTADVWATPCAIFNSNLAGATSFGQATNVKCNGKECFDLWSTMHNISRDVAVWQLADGSIFGIAANGLGSSSNCNSEPDEVINAEWFEKSSRWYCMGFIDVNGTAKPNKAVKCANGVKTDYSPDKPCVVNNASMGDQFPVVVHDGIIEPATNAAKYVFLNTK